MDIPDNFKVDLFKGKEVRKAFHEGEWWFSVVDVIGIISNTDRPSKYWNDLKNKIIEEGYTQLSDKIGKLKFRGSDGKEYPTDVATTETMLRIIQTIPSPNADPIKRWLARVGFERIEEINDPELAMKRRRADYALKGYPDEWVGIRMRSMQTREELTDEWKDRGIAGNEYGILSAELSKNTFGITPAEHSSIKGLKKENLRDHMTPSELVFTILGEISTKEIAVARDARGFNENKQAAKDGGAIAGDARKALEKKTGKKVLSPKRSIEAAKERGLEKPK